MNRRHFLSRSSALACATALAPSIASGSSLARLVSDSSDSGAAKRLKRIGLELYSVRDAMKQNPEKTMAAVRAMGYRNVELLWSMGNFGRTPKQVKATLDAEGLKAPSAHIDAKLFTDGWDKALDQAHYLGHRYLIVPSLPDGERATIDAWKKWGDRFNEAGAKARKAGIWLAFHNEPDHMKPIGGVVPYDVFVDQTSPSVVRHQLDVGNMTMGGGDPMAYLKKYAARYWSFHIKDVVPDRSHDTDLGKGTVQLKALLGAISDIDHKPLYVEQEGVDDPMGAASRDFKYLQAMTF